MERPTLAFVPGFMQRGDAWTPVAERLRERYPSVVLDHANERPPPGTVPVAYSMGGRLVLHAALEEPGRWPALVLVGVRAGVEDPEARQRTDEEMADWIESHSIEEVVERWEESPVFASQPSELREAQRAGRLSHSPADLARDLREFGQGAMPAVWDRLGEIEIPVLLIAGEFDEPYVAAAGRMAALMPDAEARSVPGCGHAPQLEAPGPVAEELRAFVNERL
jgi:2-succinyl-6-hydroxy-2,4-cyclohexadiene-1-carboxylate synthase